MSDPRYARLAEVLTGFSTELKKGERVLIDAFDVPDTFTIELVRAAQARGALPYVNVQRARITRELLKGASAGQYATTAAIELARMKRMQAYIAVRGSENIFETSDVPADRVQLVSRLMKPVLDHRVNKTKWVVLRWPTSAMAQQAGMSTEAFRGLLFHGLHLDYAANDGPGMKALARPDEQDGPRAHQGSGHRPAVFHQGHRRRALRRPAQHPGRRGVLLPGEGFASRASSSTTRPRSISARHSTTSASSSRRAASSRRRRAIPSA
jgi:hypothetical protein